MAKKVAAKKASRTPKAAKKHDEQERIANEQRLAREDAEAQKAKEKPPVKGDAPKDEAKMKVTASDDALFKALMEDAPPLKKKPEPEQMSMTPPAAYAPRGRTPGSLTFDSFFSYIIKLLVAAGLPLKPESLPALNKRLGQTKWPPILRSPLLDASGVLEKDKEMFKAYADPYVDPNADKS